MNSIPAVGHDERTEAIANASYRWSHVFLTYALLLDAAYRGLVFREAAWDLLAMVIGSGLFCLFYQARRETLPPGWALKGLWVAVVAAILGAVIAFFANHWLK